MCRGDQNYFHGSWEGACRIKQGVRVSLEESNTHHRTVGSKGT